MPISLSVFTKPWPGKSIEELGEMVHRMGFDGIELPVRPGFPVNPDNMKTALPAAVRSLERSRVSVFSVAGAATESMVGACGDSGVPTLRIMAPIRPEGYLATETLMRREFDSLLPALRRHRVRIGVQNHYGRYFCSASGLRALLKGYDPQEVGAVWDAAHNALQGEEPELALEIVWPHLAMVNLKNAYWRRTNPDKETSAEWTAYWTTGSEGLASWPRVASELKARAYTGVVCLTAEYTDEARVSELVSGDLRYAHSLFA